MMSAIFTASVARHRKVLEDIEQACGSDLMKLCEASAQALANNGRIFFFGNGGSAADAQHLAAELSVRFIHDRRALPGLALTTDSSVLTACGNDLGFEHLFARQIEAFGHPGDVAIGFSTSGNSPNVVLALECARRKGMVPAGFSGRNGGRLRSAAQVLIAVPSDETARIQEMHILLGHIFCTEIEQRLGLADHTTPWAKIDT